MNLLRLISVAAAGLILSTAVVDQAQARATTAPGQDSYANTASQNPRTRGERQSERGRNRAPEPSAEQITAAAQAVATAAGLSCRVNASTLLGKTSEDHELYEVACDGGTGYMLTNSTPPQTFDCVLLAAQADRLRAEGGEVAPGTVCALPGNQDNLSVIAGYARDAGVPCPVDAGTAIGTTTAGNVVYEVGCADADGYQIEQAAEGWKKTDCLAIMSANLTCQFTTAVEQVKGFTPLLVGTAIDDCTPERIRLMGQNDNGRFIEVKCVSGDGYVARLKDNAIEQVYACALAARIGGGCTMTEVPEATEPQ